MKNFGHAESSSRRPLKVPFRSLVQSFWQVRQVLSMLLKVQLKWDAAQTATYVVRAVEQLVSRAAPMAVVEGAQVVLTAKMCGTY